MGLWLYSAGAARNFTGGAQPTASARRRYPAHPSWIEILVHARADRQSVWSGRLVPRGPSGDAGNQPQVYACSLCHYPNGKGRPENANITGLTYEYFIQQMMDFRNGARKTSDPRKANTGLMTRFAQMMTDEEIKVAAQYFTATPATPWITVLERATVPKTKPENGMFLRLEGEESGVEPIGERIIETSEKTHDSEFLRNPRSGFIAYVPPGSLRRNSGIRARTRARV
jgi:cytochrome c553